MEEAENIELRSRPWNPKPCGKFMSCFLGVGAGLGFGVVFPTMLVFLVLITSLNENGCGWLPLPTPVHVALLVSVPLCNLVAWLSCWRGWWLDSWVPRFMNGFALVSAIVFAIELLPLTVFGFVFCVFAFWWFGLGFLGLLPGGFLYATFAGFAIRLTMEGRAKEKGHGKVRGFGIGMLAGGAVWLLLLSTALVSVWGLHLAQSKNPETVARSVKLVRMLGREDVIGNVAHNLNGNMFFDLPTAFVGEMVRREDAERFYYRISGEDAQGLREDGGRSRRRFGLRWDALVGGEKVGGVLQDLSLKGSAYDTKVDSTTGIGYAEWTMVFANGRDFGDLEARTRIALPKGAVVSRLTLWVNGEEQEAAFAGKGAVRKAYESVVSRQRDPVLVTMCGPDQIQLQCFPVTPKGEMKVRLGMTVPLAVAKDGKSARFPAPSMVARNFNYDAGMLGLPKSEMLQLEKPLPSQVAYFGKDDFAVVQKEDAEKAWRPRKMVAVVDTSAPMKSQMAAVKDALAALPADVALELWTVDDLTPSAPGLVSPADDASRAEKLAQWLKSASCAGGRDNVRVLCSALEGVAKSSEPAALLWMHGPEPFELEDGSVLPQYVRKAGEVRFYDCQLVPGECPASDKLLGAVGKVRSIAAEALDQDVAAAVKSICADWSGQHRRVVRSQVKRNEVPSECAKGDEHLARLWAYGEVLKLYREGDPEKLEKCKTMALPWHIVTPVTGAVVLESKEQFKQNGLEPVSSSSVPTVPEPSSILCFVLVALTLALVWWFKLRKRNGAA